VFIPFVCSPGILILRNFLKSSFKSIIRGIFENFIEDERRAWNEVSEGVARKIMAYDNDLMICQGIL